MSLDVHYDAAVIGGGFFGAYLALELKRRFPRVLVLEAEDELMTRASFNNQARVHNGYHYPRSILTGMRSRANFQRFVTEYREAIDDSFAQYYAVARRQSKVTARQYESFCRRIEAPLHRAPVAVAQLFNPDLIEAAYLTEEHAFDADRLRARMLSELSSAGVEIRTATLALRVQDGSGSSALGLVVSDAAGDQETLGVDYIFNCTYSRLNHILAASGLPLVPLRHELTEIALVTPPRELAQAGVTVMCGPFFSSMPFPPGGIHSLTHVRYTPHASWEERERDHVENHAILRTGRPSQFSHMLRDAARYLPVLAGAQYERSLWEIKTVLPQSESNDSRPILFSKNPGLPRLVSVLGGKLDNVYDLAGELDRSAEAS